MASSSKKVMMRRGRVTAYLSNICMKYSPLLRLKIWERPRDIRQVLTEIILGVIAPFRHASYNEVKMP